MKPQQSLDLSTNHSSRLLFTYRIKLEEFDTEEVNEPELQRQGWQAILNRFARHTESKIND